MIDLAHNPTPAPVHADTPCNGCGYNLRGLDREAVCPECGTGVALSLRGNALWFCPARWIAALYNGALFFIVGAAIQFVQWVLYYWMRDSPRDGMRWDLVALSCASLTMSVLATIAITAREPRLSTSPAGTTATGLARAILVPYALIWLVHLSLDVSQDRLLDLTALRVMNMVSIATGIALNVCVTIQCWRVARRMGRGGLARLAWVPFVLAVIGRGVWFIILGYLLVNDAVWGLPDSLMMLIDLSRWVWLIEIAVEAVFWCLLAIALRNAKARAIRESQRADHLPMAAQSESFAAPPPLPRSVSNPA